MNQNNNNQPQPAWENCQFCLKEYVRNKFHLSSQKYCSRKCRDAHRYYKDRAKRLVKVNARHKKTYTAAKGRAVYYKNLEHSPQKVKARQALSNAIHQGKMKRLPCAKCGEKITHAHHTDYSKPLDVIFLCVKHHYEQHRRKYAKMADRI